MSDDPIRLLHFSDLHIGAASYGRTDPQTGLPARVGDFFARLDELLAYAQAHEIDAALFCGNAFKSPNPTPTTQRAFARFVRALAQTCPVVLVLGAQDRPTSADKAASVEIFHTLDVPNVIVGFDYAVHRLDTRRGPLQIATAPYPARDDALAEAGGRRRSESALALDERFREALVARLRALAEQADSDAAPRVLAGHFAVQGVAAGRAGLARGLAPGVPLDVVGDPRWDYVALGYTPRHQALADAPPVVYSGGIERLGFDEAGDAKGFCRVDVARGAAAWQFVPVEARPFVTVRVDARDARKPTALVLAAAEKLDLSGAVVRVIAELSTENAHLLRQSDVRRALLAQGADHVAAVREEIEPPARAQLGVSPEQLTPHDLLARYFAQQDMSPERLDALMAAADELLGDE